LPQFLLTRLLLDQLSASAQSVTAARDILDGRGSAVEFAAAIDVNSTWFAQGKLAMPSAAALYM
jgi:hypothetical protein